MPQFFQKFIKNLPAMWNYSGDRALAAGGKLTGEGTTNTINFITLRRLGNSVNFGDLSVERYSLCATSNGVNDRAVIGGGTYTDNQSYNTIDYIKISGPGSNAQDFGDLTQDRCLMDAASNKTYQRGVFFGGQQQSNQYTAYIDYITISTASNATTFGSLTQQRQRLMSCSNAEYNRGVVGGGAYGGSYLNTIEYVTITTPSGSTDFGDLTQNRCSGGSTDNGINNRGIFGGGGVYSGSWTYYNNIDYISINSLSNAIDFGDLIDITFGISAASNGVKNRVIWLGGEGSSTADIIQYADINTTANSQEFGDLPANWNAHASAENA